jgi:hypothetical protein
VRRASCPRRRRGCPGLVAAVTDPDGLADLTAAVDLLTDSLLPHLSYEERELVEPLARLGFQ